MFLKRMLLNYWGKQEFDLNLPDNELYSDCMYYPIKGKTKLWEIAQAELSADPQTEMTPASIDWWIKMEKHRAGI